MRTVKGLLEYSNDPYKALLSDSATLFPWCSLSPAELLMGRKVSTDTPEIKTNLIPWWPYLDTFKYSDKKFKLKQKENYNQRR